MKFRPCIDIHNGRVKQIVGGTLSDVKESELVENFVSNKSAADYAKLYKQDNLTGGHVIILNSADSEHYEASKNQALSALSAYPQGLQIGGGINDENARHFIEAGASHVIVTSFVFHEGEVHYDNLRSLVSAVGKSRLVLDLSCRRRDGGYYIVSNRWQTFTDVQVNAKNLAKLALYCDEFLIHAVDAEGRQAGIDEDLVRLLADWGGLPITYAGGVGTYADIERLKIAGQGRLDVTVGSALDLFGGPLSYERIVKDYGADF